MPGGSPPLSCPFRDALRTCSVVSCKYPPMKRRTSHAEGHLVVQGHCSMELEICLQNCPQSESKAGLLRACPLLAGHPHPPPKLEKCDLDTDPLHNRKRSTGTPSQLAWGPSSHCGRHEEKVLRSDTCYGSLVVDHQLLVPFVAIQQRRRHHPEEAQRRSKIAIPVLRTAHHITYLHGGYGSVYGQVNPEDNDKQNVFKTLSSCARSGSQEASVQCGAPFMRWHIGLCKSGLLACRLIHFGMTVPVKGNRRPRPQLSEWHSPTLSCSRRPGRHLMRLMQADSTNKLM